jgi:hypothetical protein
MVLLWLPVAVGVGVRWEEQVHDKDGVKLGEKDAERVGRPVAIMVALGLWLKDAEEDELNDAVGLGVYSWGRVGDTDWVSLGLAVRVGTCEAVMDGVPLPDLDGVGEKDREVLKVWARPQE